MFSAPGRRNAAARHLLLHCVFGRTHLDGRSDGKKALRIEAKHLFAAHSLLKLWTEVMVRDVSCLPSPRGRYTSTESGTRTGYY